MLTAMDVPGFDGRIPLPGDLFGACVLAGLRGRALQVGFPSARRCSSRSAPLTPRDGDRRTVLPDLERSQYPSSTARSTRTRAFVVVVLGIHPEVAFGMPVAVGTGFPKSR